MSDIQIFKNEKFGEIRVNVNEQGEPMFCLADVCKAVGLTNASSVKSRLDKDDVQVFDLHALNLTEGSIGNTKANFITESGFYDVLLYSDAPQVKPFRKWVTSEVLPSIRKTGQYAVKPLTQGQMLVQMAQAYEAQERMLLEQQEKQRKMQSQIHRLECITDVNYGFMAVLGYAKIHGIDVSRKEAAKIGKAVSRYCRDNKIQYGSQKHPIFGNVNIYPDHALQAVFPKFYPNVRF